MDDPSTSGVTEGFDLMFYNARWYDPYLARFAQADSIVPAGVQGYDRYAYVNNNPVNYNDPSGHIGCRSGERCLNNPLATASKAKRTASVGMSCSTCHVLPTKSPTRTATPTQTALPTFTPTPTLSCIGIPCNPTATSSLPCLLERCIETYNSPTPYPTITPVPPFSSEVKEAFGEGLPSYDPRPSTVIPVGSGFENGKFWDDVLKTLPLLGYPATSMDEIANRAVDSVDKFLRRTAPLLPEVPAIPYFSLPIQGIFIVPENPFLDTNPTIIG
jgi:RHS repeat-associated protein